MDSTTEIPKNIMVLVLFRTTIQINSQSSHRIYQRMVREVVIETAQHSVRILRATLIIYKRAVFTQPPMPIK